MKKMFAGLVAIMILLCGCTAAFADQKILTREEAIQAALDQVGLKEENVTFMKTELEWDDGLRIWDIEFFCDGLEYEFAIDARTGRILARDISRQDRADWDDWDDIFDYD